jgi:hypothetical protein
MMFEKSLEDLLRLPQEITEDPHRYLGTIEDTERDDEIHLYVTEDLITFLMDASDGKTEDEVIRYVILSSVRAIELFNEEPFSKWEDVYCECAIIDYHGDYNQCEIAIKTYCHLGYGNVWLAD